jgi:hypothetical protein|tara:strand:+ start:1211 stop:1438 length:228 start_codon:yes stop_codon:yes gene_type:complete
MKTRQSIEKQLFQISEEESSNLMALIEDINQIRNKKVISEDTITKLGNVITMLDSLKENYMWRLLRAAKQNHMLD